MRISQNALRGVVFFGGPSPPDGAIKYRGTGFLVGYRDPVDDKLYPYLVTARHVASGVMKDSEVVIRANLKSGEGKEIPLGPINWAYPKDDSIDLAAAPYYLDQTIYDTGYFDLMNEATTRGPFVDAKGDTRNNVCCGDELAIVGLFHLHAGGSRNVPVVHTGHVSVLADPNERLPLWDPAARKKVMAEAYLVETQSLGGLSGSPVFIAQLMDMDVRTPEGNKPVAFAGIKMLGVYVGSWDGDPDEVLKKDRRLDDGTKVPVGMGIVVPVDHLIELIRDHEMLIRQRDKDREDEAKPRRDTCWPL